MKRLIHIALVLITTQTFAQVNSNNEYDRIRLGDGWQHLLGLDINPNGNELAISCRHELPLLKYELEAGQITDQMNVGAWKAGARVEYSPMGSFLVLEKFKLADWAQNRKNPTTYEVVNAQTKQVILTLDETLEVAFSSDESELYVLHPERIDVYQVGSWQVDRSHTVSSKTFALAVHPNNSTIAIAEPSRESYVRSLPQYQHKKAKKALQRPFVMVDTLNFQSERARLVVFGRLECCDCQQCVIPSIDHAVP